MPTVSTVKLATAAGTAQGHLVKPGTGRSGVVVIQEWWGLVPHIKDVAARFAAQGYTALAPDLYHGKTTVDAEEAQHLMQGLDWSCAAQELAGAVKYLRDVEHMTHVGVVGFCMGGALTMVATAQGGIDAYAAFYGFPPKNAAQLDRIEAPGLIFFGEHETFFSISDAKAFAQAQRARGRRTEVVVYPGAGHAFFNNDRPEAYHQASAKDAWRRTLDLFGKELR